MLELLMLKATFAIHAKAKTVSTPHAKRAFTLIELFIVIAIIAILAAIPVPDLCSGAGESAQRVLPLQHASVFC
jgi:prepilin-type N-terminal cleavage/methylation domain-containing protein